MEEKASAKALGQELAWGHLKSSGNELGRQQRPVWAGSYKDGKDFGLDSE